MNENKCQIVLIRNTEKCKKGFLNVVLKKKNDSLQLPFKNNQAKIRPILINDSIFLFRLSRQCLIGIS